MTEKIKKKSNNIKFSNEFGSFNTRVIGVCIKDEKILLSKMEGDEHWTLIGGKVKFGEDSSMAVLREYKEETGADLQVERLLSVIENFFKIDEEKWHQYIFMYLLKDDLNGLELFEGPRNILDNEKVIMQWFELSELSNLIIKPNVLTKTLVNMPDKLMHVINRDK